MSSPQRQMRQEEMLSAFLLDRLRKISEGIQSIAYTVKSLAEDIQNTINITNQLTQHYISLAKRVEELTKENEELRKKLEEKEKKKGGEQKSQ